ncbi:hypothetical protein O1L60_24255 [Streptomyces diastatochromogenes]|nr:hypothetical protein [Streptomyces diastatochromogenes]
MGARGTTTSQQPRPRACAPGPTGSPQPRCGASLVVWRLKAASPVPSGWVATKNSSLVSPALKYVQSVTFFVGGPDTGVNGTNGLVSCPGTSGSGIGSAYCLSSGSVPGTSSRRAMWVPKLPPLVTPAPNWHCSRFGPAGSSPQHCMIWR